jgi:hypothetical protein
MAIQIITDKFDFTRDRTSRATVISIEHANRFIGHPCMAPKSPRCRAPAPGFRPYATLPFGKGVTRYLFTTLRHSYTSALRDHSIAVCLS